MRTYSDLQQYVEKSTEALVQSLRNGDPRVKAVPPQMQAEGRDPLLRGAVRRRTTPQLMSRAADNAMVVVERKPSRAGVSSRL